MKASDYRDLLRRKNESGVFDATAHTENPAVKKAWDEFNAHTVKLGAGYRLYTDIQAFLSTRKIAVRDEKFAHKLAAFLSKPEAAQHHLPKLTFGDIALLFAQNGVRGDGFSTAADFYEYLSLVPPLSPELHQQMIAAQKLSMGTSVERTGRNVVTEAIKRKVLRPLLSHPRVVEARLAQEVAHRKQSFLEDGITPAGIQHVLAGQAQAASRNARIPSMTTPESGGVPGLDASAEIAQRTASDVQKLLERAAVNPNNLSFKEKLQLYALCGEGINALTFKNSAGDDVEIERTTSFSGRTFKIRGGQALEGVSVNVADQRRFANLWQSDAEYLRFGTVLETKIAEIAPGNPANQSEIKAVLQAEPFSNHFFRILTGETIASDIGPLLEGYKKAEQTHENKIRHAALTALAQAASFNELTDLYYTQDGRKAELEDQKYWPNEIKKVLLEGKKYTNNTEKGHMIDLLDLSNGENRKWGKFSYTIVTEADGSRLYTRKSKRGAPLTFRLTTAEQKQLRDTDTESTLDPEKEAEEVKKALAEIKKRLSGIERGSERGSLDAEKKIKHIQYLDLLLKDGATFPGEYYEKPKPGEGSKDKRTQVRLLKAASGDVITVSGYPISGFSGEIPGIALSKVQLAAWKAKLEGAGDELKIPAKLQSALTTLRKADATLIPSGDERSILERYMNLLATVKTGAATGTFQIDGFRVKKNAVGDAYIFYVDTGDAATSTKEVFTITEPERAKWERIKNEVPSQKIPGELKTALDVLPGWDKTKYFDNDAQRAVLDKYLKPLVDPAHRPAKIGDFDIADDAHSFKFSKDGKPAFTITASQVALWRDISAVPKPPEPPRLPPSDALPAGVLEQSIVGTDGWEDELGRRVGTKLLMGKLNMEQGQISKEKALDYVKGLGFWKRMGLYAALALGTAAVAIGASYLIGAGIAASIGWGAAFSAKWFGLMGLKIAATAGIAFGTNHLLRKKWLDKRYGLTGTNGEPLISFMERSKDASGYYRALKEFRKDKKEFDTKEGKLARARNQVRSTGTPEFVAAKYQMGMDTVMAHHEKGARNERTRQFLIPIAIGGGIAGATAYYHWDIIKSLMPGSRPPSGALPPTTGRGGPPPLTRGGQPPVPQGPRFVQDRFGRWILPNSGQYIEVYCGAPRASCIPCDFTINGTRAHWYINSFADSMSVASPKGGMSHLLGNMNTIPGGRATQEQVWSLFERTLCADRDLYRTFYNVGNSSKGRWIDFAVLKETTWIGGRKQTMIDVMIDRAGNENVRSTLRAMRESIIQNNPRLSVRLAR